MAKKNLHPKNQKTETLNPSLAEIVAAGPGGTFAHLTHVEGWAYDGLVEVNPEGPDATGRIAVRATEKGIESMKKPSVQIETFGIEIEEGIPLPSVTGRGKQRKSVFPIDKLEIGQSFFVADTEDVKAAKLLTSALTSAHKFYSEIVPGEFRETRKGNSVPLRRQTRQFVMRSVPGGARVWRVEAE